MILRSKIAKKWFQHLFHVARATKQGKAHVPIRPLLPLHLEREGAYWHKVSIQ